VFSERGVVSSPARGAACGLRRLSAPRYFKVASPPNNGMQRTRKTALLLSSIASARR
jgi:hypothetical protein